MKKNNFDKTTKIMIVLLSCVVGAIFGYIYEVIFYKIDTGKFINRGTTLGPWIPIYAFGSLLIILLSKNHRENPLYIFTMSLISTTALELITGYLLFHISGTRLWDYNTEILNYGNVGGYICLRSSLFFAFSGLLLMYGMLPLIEKIASKAKKDVFYSITVILSFLFISDFLCNSIILKIFK